MLPKRCKKNCLECELPKCIHDIADERRMIDEKFKARQKEIDKVRHAKYYKENKAEIDAKQKKYDEEHRNAEKCHEYYLKHKEEINERHRRNYAMNRELYVSKAKEYYYANREEISRRRKERRLAKKNAV